MNVRKLAEVKELRLLKINSSRVVGLNSKEHGAMTQLHHRPTAVPPLS